MNTSDRPRLDLACYLCGSSAFERRPGVVRDAPSLFVVECSDCGLVTLSSLEHITPGHYENSGMHGDIAQTVDNWRRGAAADDERRVHMLAPRLANRRLLDFGSGACGFLLKART